MNPAPDTATLRLADVRRRFDRAAADFDTADFVHRVTRDGLFARIRPMAVTAATVLDLGSATGAALRPLRQRFRGARIVAVDLSARMLERLRGRGTVFTRPAAVQADACALPFADASVDVVFSNLLLPWIDTPSRLFAEIARVLRQDGLFAFATLGPDSLLALRQAWQCVDDAAHVNAFTDMHDVGDALVRAGLRDPVLDVDRLALQYAGRDALFRDLTAAGARNCLALRGRGLTGRRRFAAMCDALFTAGTLTTELELVYGHCWGGAPRAPGTEVAVDARRIPLRRR